MKFTDQDIENLSIAMAPAMQIRYRNPSIEDILSCATNLHESFVKKERKLKVAYDKAWLTILILEFGNLTLLKSYLKLGLNLYNLQDKREPTILDRSLYINYGNPINLYLLKRGLKITLKEDNDYDKQEQNILGYLYPTKTAEEIHKMYFTISIMKVLVIHIEKIFKSVVNSTQDLSMNSSTIPSNIASFSRDLPNDLYDHTNYSAAFGTEENSECVAAIVKRAVRIISKNKNTHEKLQASAKIEDFLTRVKEEHIDPIFNNNFVVLRKVVADYQYKNEKKFNQNFLKNIGESIFKSLPQEIILQITSFKCIS